MGHWVRMEKKFWGRTFRFDFVAGIAILKNSKVFPKRYPQVSFLKVCRLQYYDLRKITRRYCDFFQRSYSSNCFYSWNGAKFGILGFLLLYKNNSCLFQRRLKWILTQPLIFHAAQNPWLCTSHVCQKISQKTW